MVLSGKEVAAAIRERVCDKVAALKASGTEPTLAILRVGEKNDDIVYENSAVREAAKLGITVKKVILAEGVELSEVLCAVNDLNNDDSVHGVLMLRPFPKHLDDELICEALCPEKDVDGITAKSAARVYAGRGVGYSPCTAQACMEILGHYDIDCSGKSAVVLGRSLVIGKPVAMMLMQKNATVTVCHSKTENIKEQAKRADILICAMGKAKMVDDSWVKDGAYVLDVGMNWDEEKGKLCGDCDYEKIADIANATPVPGGVGAVTTVVLMQNTVHAAENKK